MLTTISAFKQLGGDVFKMETVLFSPSSEAEQHLPPRKTDVFV
jgi:hypothetical protein